MEELVRGVVAAVAAGSGAGYLVGAAQLADGLATVATVLAKIKKRLRPLKVGEGFDTTDEVLIHLMSTGHCKLAEMLLCSFCLMCWISLLCSLATMWSLELPGRWLFWIWPAAVGVGIMLRTWLEDREAAAGKQDEVLRLRKKTVEPRDED